VRIRAEAALGYLRLPLQRITCSAQLMRAKSRAGAGCLSPPEWRTVARLDRCCVAT